jgi:drug/metabolite transporter (DMT)-like permease
VSGASDVVAVAGPWRATGAALVTVVVWASAFVAIRVALPELGVGGLAVARLLVASAALAVLAPVMKVRAALPRDLPRMAMCGLTGMTGYILLLNAGERTVPAGTASLLVNTAPVFAALLAWALLGDTPTRRGWCGIVIGFVGATVMSVGHGSGFAPSADALLVLAAAASFALFFAVQKPLLTRYRGFEVTCYATWFGTAAAVPFGLGVVPDLRHASVDALMAVAFLGLGASALGFVTWAYALARMSVSTAANTLYLVPFTALGVGWLLLDEAVEPVSLVGGLVALTGVVVSRSSGAPRRSG